MDVSARLQRWVAGLVALAMAVTVIGVANTPPRVLADGCVEVVPGWCSASGGEAPIVVLDPWDRMIQDTSAGQWDSLASEARASVALLYDVPNDRQLLHWGRDEIRGFMYARLLSIIKKQGNGEALTADEQLWLTTLQSQMKARRVAKAQKAVDEYNRWSADRCTYQPPAGYGFTSIPTHAWCNDPFYVGLPPAPPSAEQFQAYAGVLVDGQKFGAADAQAAWKNTVTALTFLSSLAAAGAISAALAAAIAASSSLAFSIAGAMGSALLGYSAVSSALALGVAPPAWAASAATTVAIGAGVSVVMIIALASVVTAIALWQLIEAEQVPTKLAEALSNAQNETIDLASLAATPEGNVEMFSAVLGATLDPTHGDWTAERIAKDSPPAHTAADPEFLVDGSTTGASTIVTRDWNGTPQETYMVGRWFATKQGTGDFEWSLSLHYLDGGGGRKTAYLDDVDGFLSSPPGDSTSPPPATTSQALVYSTYDGLTLRTHTATWHGNHLPSLAPTYPSAIDQSSPFTLTAHATDLDANDPVTVTWLVEPDPGLGLAYQDPSATSECREGGLPPTSTCNWPRHTGDQVTLNYQTPGTYLARVFATDSHGTRSESSFNFTVRNVAPRFTSGPTLTMNGLTATVAGTFDDPGDASVKVKVDWGDGTSSNRLFPCDFTSGCSSDAPLAHPSTFSLQHTYADPGATYPVDVSLYDGFATTHATPQVSVAPTVSGDLLEGSVLTFDAHASHSAAGTGYTVEWMIEPDNPQSSFLVVDPAVDALCRAATGPGDGCNWPKVSGATAQQTYRVAGDYAARAIVTDVNGARVGAAVTFHVGNAPAAFTDGPTAVAAADVVTVAGQFADPGNDEVQLTVDWGDGTTTSRRYACDSSGLVICIGINPAARPTTFSFQHTYSGPVPAGYPTVKLDDGTDITGPTIAPLPAPQVSVAPTVSGDLLEGSVLTFDAHASHSAAGTGYTVEWMIEPDNPQSSFLVVDPAVDALCRAATGPGDGCNWPKVSGATAQQTYRVAGDYAARAIVTDVNGARVGAAVTFHVGNAPAAFTDGPTAVAAADVVTVAGQFADPGNDEVQLTVDWGDGTTTSRRYACDSSGLVICIGINPAARPTTFSFQHTYAGPVPAGYPTVKLDDGTDITGPTIAPLIAAPAPPTSAAASSTVVGQATVSFTPPAGGVPISGYRATCVSPTGATGSADGATSPIVVTGLTANAVYGCTVVALNGRYTSDPSNSAPVTVMGLSVPGAPGSVTARMTGRTELTVEFTAPTDDGHSPITGYTVTCTSPTGATRSVTRATAGSVAVGSLTARATYTCAVVATNAVGRGPAATSAAVLLVAHAPGAPTAARASTRAATGWAGRLDVAFTPPVDNGGAAITDYTATCTSPTGVTRKKDGPASPISVYGLTAGSVYTCTVVARNSAGLGTASTPSEPVTVLGQPGAPRIVSATSPSRGRLTVTIAPPSSNGGSPITGYSVGCISLRGIATAQTTTTTATLSGLPTSTTWICVALAENALGEGPPSAPSPGVRT